MSSRVTLPPIRPEEDVPRAQWRARTLAILTNLLFWPGIGHFFVGRRRAGLLWAGGSIALILAAPLHVLLPVAGFLATRLGSVLDVGFGRVRFTDTNRTVPWVLVGLAVAFGFMLFQRRLYLQAFTIPTVTMAPTLIVGDHLFTNGLAYRFGEVKRGDLAVFVFPCEPDSTHKMIQRVIGLAGDTIEVRCDVVYVNGHALTQRLEEADCNYWDRDPANQGFHRRSCSRYSEAIDGETHGILDTPDRPELDRKRGSAAAAYEQVAGSDDFPGGDMPGCAVEEHPAPAGRIEKSAPSSGIRGACAPRRHYIVPAGHIFVLADNRHEASDSRSWGPVPLELVKGRAFGIWWSSGPREEEVRWERIGAIH